MDYLFIRVEESGTSREWGYCVPSSCIPSAGDRLVLGHAEPDDKSENSGDIVSGKVLRRDWTLDCLADCEDEGVSVIVELEEDLPEGHIPDSTAWPAKDESKRKAEFAARMVEFEKRLKEFEKRLKEWHRQRESNLTEGG